MEDDEIGDNTVRREEVRPWFEQIEIPEQIDTEEMIKSLFSKVCDAPAFRDNQKIRETKIESGGYYREGFYMLHPFYYLDGRLGLASTIKSGIVFTAIRADADLDSLSIKEILPDAGAEAIEYLPIVLFRNHRGDICPSGTTTDLSMQFHCYNDTYEFIGVYKAQKLPDGEHCKLIKLFDRYYFDSEKIRCK